MKAYLNTQGWVFKLQPKTTRVGRHQDNDLCLRNAGVEESHALIEWCEAEHCHVLTDLDSSHGTYVNGCRIHNASVRLSPGDQLHFGYGGSAYDLTVDSSVPLPLLGRDQSAVPPAWVWEGPPLTPHPPHGALPLARARPAQEPDAPGRATRSWPGNTGSKSSARSPMVSQSLQSLQHLLQEKEERVLHLGDEVCRLSVFESECVRKDRLISSLRDEVSALSHQLTHSQAQVDVTHTLNSLQTEISLKTQQIQELKEQLLELQVSSEQVKQAVSDRDLKITSLRAQLDRMKNDHTKNLGLVSSLQSDLSSKDRHTQKLTAELDRLRQDIRHKDAQLQNLSSKFSKKQQADTLAHDNEVNSLKKTVESLEASLRNSQRDVRLISSDRDSLMERLQDRTQETSSLKVELDKQRQQLVETQTQQHSTHQQLQLFQKQVLQATNTATNHTHSPTEQEVLEAVRALAVQEEALQSRLQELQEQLAAREEELGELRSSVEEERRRREEEMERLTQRLQEGEREREEERETLRMSLEEQKRRRVEEEKRTEQETEALRSKLEEFQAAGGCVCVCVCAPLRAVQVLTHSLLHTLLTPLLASQNLLKHAGLDVDNTSDGLVCAIQLLCQQKEQCHAELERLQLVEGQLEEEGSIKMQMEQLRAELESSKTEEAVLQERLRSLEAEWTVRLEEAERREEEWRMSAKEREQREEEWRRRVGAAEERAEDLRRSREEQEEEVQERDERERNGEMEDKENRNAQTISLLEERLQEMERERDGLRERLKDMQTELKDKASPTSQSPTHSKQGSSPEAVASLRASLTRAQQEVVSRDDIIAALSRDLSQAHARMSDMTGELSEEQKAELERHRVLVVEQRVELSALTQRLAMMSQLVEQKDKELKDTKLTLRQSIEDNQKERVKELEYPSLELSSHNPKHTQEVAVSDLSEQGLKCRGHRHEEVMRLQQEALSELRSRMRALELNWPIKLLSQHQDPPQKKPMQNSQRAVGQKRMIASMCGFPLSSAVLSEASLERTARLDMTDALELSEQTYLDLARALCEALELSEGQLPGCAPLRHLSPGERERLASLRERDLELLRSRLALTNSQGQRTLLQLQESQRELYTLRAGQAEMQQLRSRLESVCVELQKEREETALLREALEHTHTHTHTRLEHTHAQSRQRNAKQSSAQQKVVFVGRPERRRVPHNCGQKAEHEERLSIERSSLQEKLRKRDYEVETLKKHLREREEELTHVTSQLTCMTSQTPPPETTPTETDH
ncbi:forkhead-associated domain-containing protein 1-like [Alosa alosa]|nr:forkhead-associated domain-containing protein 1-like [Alosa alosa]